MKKCIKNAAHDGIQRPAKGPLNIPAPRVRWCSKRDQEAASRFKDARGFVQEIVDEVWSRLPQCVRLIVDRFASNTVELVNVCDTERDGYGDEIHDDMKDIEGRLLFNSSVVVLNIACFGRSSEDRKRLVWVTAHMLVCAYLGRLDIVGWYGFERIRKSARIKALFYSKTRAPDVAIADAIRFRERDKPGPSNGAMKFDERMSDAVACACGFMREYCVYYGVQRAVGESVNRRRDVWTENDPARSDNGSWRRSKRIG